MTEMQTAASALTQVLATAVEAQRLREQGVEACYCPTCDEQTVPREGRCLWCGNRLPGA